ncbi:MAG: amidohydrolase [Treponema sp.]|jgi:predicted amidohydrolase YtcJ|nr:amidohydrolase [Treponema sp.]
MFKTDTNYVNGKIYTMAREGEIISAFSVLNGKIVAAGTSEEIAAIPAKETVDLQSRTVLPGFQDTHCHIGETTEDSKKINLVKTRSLDDVLSVLSDVLVKKQYAKWIIAYNINSALLKENRLPDRHDLDKVSGTVPIFVTSYCGHNYTCNTAALKAFGFDRNFKGDEKHSLDRDANGDPTGLIREHSLLNYINKIKPSALGTHEDCKDALVQVLKDFSSKGITTVHTCDGMDGSYCDEPAIYQALEQEQRLPMRVVFDRWHSAHNMLGAVSGFGSDKIKYGAVKLLTDGSFSEWSACLKEDYSDRKGCRGIPIYTDEKLLELMGDAYEEGDDLAVHAIGDAAVEQFLQTVRKIYDPSRKQQFRLIHATFSRPEQMDEMTKYPIIIDTQPMFLPNMALMGTPRLGSRARWMLPFKSMFDRGLIVTGGDDSPVCNNNPFLGIRYAVTRECSAGSSNLFFPEECLSVYQAVSMYTRNASYDEHEEKIKGTMEEGKLADFIVLDRDIFKIPTKEISDIKVIGTYIGGKKV